MYVINTLVALVMRDRRIRSVMVVEGPKRAVQVTRRHKPDGRDCRQEFVVTVGSPNYIGRLLIKKGKRDKMDFPYHYEKLYSNMKKKKCRK